MSNCIRVSPNNPPETVGYGRVIYDSGIVASGAVINSGILDLRCFSSIRIIAYNADGAATRALTCQEYLSDLATPIPSTSTPFTIATVATSSASRYGFAPLAKFTADPSAGVPVAASFSLATNGSSNGRLTIVGF